MKIIFKLTCFAAVVCLQGCNGCIKNKSREQPLPASTSNLPVPVSTDNVVVKSTKDLTGYWVGRFFTHEITMSQQFYTINISIDDIVGTMVKGHTIIAGKVRFFTCKLNDSDSKYNFTFKGSAADKENGLYRFSIARGDSALTGIWKPAKGEIFAGKYTLTKKLFSYNPTAGLVEARYIDFEKTKIVTRKIDKQIDSAEMYATITTEVTKYNPSVALLYKNEVANLKKTDLLILRNSIFARHGYIFKDAELYMFFSQQPWYVPIKADINGELTGIEKKNIDLLMRYEKTAQEYYDTFGR